MNICNLLVSLIFRRGKMKIFRIYFVVLLMSFKRKDKNLILTFNYHPSYAEGYSGVIFNVEKIFNLIIRI